MRNGRVGSPGSSWCERLKMTSIFLLVFLGHSAIGHEEEPADPLSAEEAVVEGPEELRFHGLNILGKDLDVQMSDPSERELKNLAKPVAREALTLDQLKEKYKEKLEELEKRQQQKRHNRDEL
ncbi:uncharacterized protein LOC134766675 [Penaeus indicus]|uniref:uncharacterized protein LOC134766675 n=1 Tax=Penaeus indicus TaxID=29960 RepID=UPI00300CBB50